MQSSAVSWNLVLVFHNRMGTTGDQPSVLTKLPELLATESCIQSSLSTAWGSFPSSSFTQVQVVQTGFLGTLKKASDCPVTASGLLNHVCKSDASTRTAFSTGYKLVSVEGGQVPYWVSLEGFGKQQGQWEVVWDRKMTMNEKLYHV